MILLLSYKNALPKKDLVIVTRPMFKHVTDSQDWLSPYKYQRSCGEVLIIITGSLGQRMKKSSTILPSPLSPHVEWGGLYMERGGGIRSCLGHVS